MNEDLFLAAAWAAPDEIGPRLVLADWLKERGDGRGRFVAYACRLYGVQPRRGEHLESRLAAVFERRKTDWFGGLRRDECVFVGGLLEEISLTVNRLAALGPGESLRQVRRLTLTRGWGSLWLGEVHLANVARLHNLASLRFPEAMRGSLHELAPLLPRVARIEIDGGHVDASDLGALATAPHVVPLEALSLREDRIDARGVVALIGSPRVSGLASLDLSGNPLDLGGAIALAGAEHLSRLASLDVRRCRIGAAGLRALLRSEHLSGLVHLAVDPPHAALEQRLLRERFGDP